MSSELDDLFYNAKSGLSSADKLYKKAKELGLKYTLKEIKKYVDNQYVTQVFKPVVRPKYFSTITEDKIRDNYQLDLMIYDRYEYHHYKYILVVVDIYSRYADARALTNRENKTIMENLKDILKEMGRPAKFSCDNEFDTKEFEKYCNEHDIFVDFSEPNDIQKNSIVERLNRTLAGYIKKLRIGLKQYNWPKALPQILENYNSSYHRMIRNTPFDIFFKKAKNKQDVIIVPRDFKVGDKVRLKIKKKVFDKGDSLSYSKEVYDIEEIDNVHSTTHYLLDNGIYYSGNKLKKVSDIFEYNRNEDDGEEQIHNENQKKRKINRKLKQMGISGQNIIVQPKRTRIRENILNL